MLREWSRYCAWLLFVAAKNEKLVDSTTLVNTKKVRKQNNMDLWEMKCTIKYSQLSLLHYQRCLCVSQDDRSHTSKPMHLTLYVQPQERSSLLAAWIECPQIETLGVILWHNEEPCELKRNSNIGTPLPHEVLVLTLFNFFMKQVFKSIMG